MNFTRSICLLFVVSMFDFGVDGETNKKNINGNQLLKRTISFLYQALFPNSARGYSLLLLKYSGSKSSNLLKKLVGLACKTMRGPPSMTKNNLFELNCPKHAKAARLHFPAVVMNFAFFA